MANCVTETVTYDDDFGKFIPLDSDAKRCICDTLNVEYVHNDNTIHPRHELPLGPPCTRATVKGDGNCFFRAISKAVSNTENNHVKIRSRLASYLQRLGAREAHRVACLDSWAGALELEAMATMLQLRIYTYSLGKWTCTHNKPTWDRSIYLVNEREYYNLVQCVESPDGGCNTCYQGTVVPLRYGSPNPMTWSGNGRHALGQGLVPDDADQGLAPLSDDEELESEQGEVLRPWTVLSKTWDPFIEYLGDCWWGDINLATVVDYMNFSVDGEIIIAGPTSTDPGIVCSVFVWAKPCAITHHIMLYGCEYKCPTVTDKSFTSLIDCMSHIVSTVHSAVILSPGRHGSNCPFMLFGTLCRVCYCGELANIQTSALSAMVAEIAKLPDSEYSFRRANKVTGEHVTFDDILKCVSKRRYSYGVVVYNKNRNVPGYLFDIVTADGPAVVTFSQQLGYVMETDGYTACYPTLERLSLDSRFSMIFLHRIQLGVAFHG